MEKITYDSSVHKQDMCPITQSQFESGDELTRLPCHHYFETDAVEHWLKNEKAECPVCRLKLEHVEETIEEDDNDNDNDNDNERDPLQFATERMMLYNSLSRISDTHPFGPREGIEYFVRERDGDDDLQTAIIASLLDV